MANPKRSYPYAWEVIQLREFERTGKVISEAEAKKMAYALFLKGVTND